LPVTLFRVYHSIAIKYLGQARTIVIYIYLDGHGYIDLAVDADQESIFFMGSVTPPSACYCLHTFAQT